MKARTERENRRNLGPQKPIISRQARRLLRALVDSVREPSLGWELEHLQLITRVESRDSRDRNKGSELNDPGSLVMGISRQGDGSPWAKNRG